MKLHIIISILDKNGMEHKKNNGIVLMTIPFLYYVTILNHKLFVTIPDAGALL